MLAAVATSVTGSPAATARLKTVAMVAVEPAIAPGRPAFGARCVSPARRATPPATSTRIDPSR